MRIALVSLLAGVAALCVAFAMPADADQGTAACWPPFNFRYVSWESVKPWHGIAATITELEQPEIASGHLAAWVTVGGEGEESDGTGSWVQIGVWNRGGVAAMWAIRKADGYQTDTTGNVSGGVGDDIYVETISRDHYSLRRIGAVQVGQPIRVAVLEMASRPGWWRAWLNGRPVSSPIYLTLTFTSPQPMDAAAEDYNDVPGHGCNHFAYRFSGIAVASRRGGGAWYERPTGTLESGDHVQGRMLAGPEVGFLATG